MIISFFGPDGVGKSTAAEELQANGFQVFSGTNVASWPETSWHEELVAKGIDETALDSEDHFKEKIKRAHKLARDLEKPDDIVIDSDPLYKTLMFDYTRALPDKEKARQRVAERFDELKQLAGFIPATKRLHVLFRVSNSLSLPEQAKILQERVSGRGELSHFDPGDLESSLHMVEACEVIKDTLEAAGEKVVVIATDKPLTDKNRKQSLVSLIQHHADD